MADRSQNPTADPGQSPMADRSLFISSCSRRDLARRKSGRAPARRGLGQAPARAPLLLTLAVLVLALAAVLAARGGL